MALHCQVSAERRSLLPSINSWNKYRKCPPLHKKNSIPVLQRTSHEISRSLLRTAIGCLSLEMLEFIYIITEIRLKGFSEVVWITQSAQRRVAQPGKILLADLCTVYTSPACSLIPSMTSKETDGEIEQMSCVEIMKEWSNIALTLVHRWCRKEHLFRQPFLKALWTYNCATRMNWLAEANIY